MTNNKEILAALREPMPYKWRAQSSRQYSTTCVAYVDSRQVQDRLDEVMGTNWSFEFISGGKDHPSKGRMSLSFDGGATWIVREDVGTESNQDKEKGEASDCLKRSAVQWGVGRFLYSLGTVSIPSYEMKPGKYAPCVFKNDAKSRFYTAEDLTDFCVLVKELGLQRAQDMWRQGKKKLPQQANKQTQTKPTAKVEPVTAEPAKPQSESTMPLIKRIGEVGKHFMESRALEGSEITDALNKFTSNFAGTLSDWKKADSKTLEDVAEKVEYLQAINEILVEHSYLEGGKKKSGTTALKKFGVANDHSFSPDNENLSLEKLSDEKLKELMTVINDLNVND